MSNSRGMHKVEFYMALDEIKELYKQGYVVFKILYEEMKRRRNWEMSYWSFCKYAKKELLEDTIKKTFLEDENIMQKNEDQPSQKESIFIEDNDGPIIPQSTVSKGFNYNPSTKELDPKKTI